MHRRNFVLMTAGMPLVTRLSLSRVQSRGFRAPAESFLRGLPGLMEPGAVPGLSLAVVQGEHSPFTHAVGSLSGQGAAPIGPDTRFEAASLSKPVFAYLVMLLVQDGKLDIEKPLDQYLGSAYVPEDARAAGITARHVLSHTTGYRNWRFNADQRLATDFPPGERFQYSGEGYYQLQRVVETISGRGMAVLARERVFQPLGMARSSFAWKSDFESEAVVGHRRDGTPITSQGRRTSVDLDRTAVAAGSSLESWRHEEIVAALRAMTPPPPTNPVMLSPNAAGSLLTTASDYARFVAVMLGAARGPLGDELRGQMMVRRIALRAGLGWGLGWGLEERNGRTLIWHWGDNPGFKNFVMADPQSRTGVIVFTNGDNGRPVYERVVRAAADFDPAAFLWI